MLPRLCTHTFGRPYFVLDEVDSTNSWLWRSVEELPHGAAVRARFQSAGKGTRKRVWSAPPDSSLMLSFLLRESVSPRDLSLLPLLAGMAVCDAVLALTGFCPGIKWPNDIVADSKKLCGILCESRLSAGGACAVVGLGVNLTQTAEELLRLDLVYAASLHSVTGYTIAPDDLAGAVLNAFEPLWNQYLAEGFPGALRERYRSLCVTLGREVLCIREGAQENAWARDIAPDGALLVDGAHGPEAVYAGDVSVRGLYGYI